MTDLTRKALTEARKIVDTLVGENMPSRQWAKTVLDMIDAALAVSAGDAEGETRTADPAMSDVARQPADAENGTTNLELPDDLFSHRSAWHHGLTILRDTAEMEDKSYWQHEIKVFDRTFNALKEARMASQSASAAVVDALRRLEVKAEKQKAYFQKVQRGLPCLEDCIDEDGNLALHGRISPLLAQTSANGRYSEADWWLSTIRRAIAEAADPGSSGDDAKRIDVLVNESWDLRCFSIPTGGDDYDIGWRVVGHWQAEPHERTIAEVFSDNPRAAIDAAIVAARNGGYDNA